MPSSPPLPTASTSSPVATSRTSRTTPLESRTTPLTSRTTSLGSRTTPLGMQPRPRRYPRSPTLTPTYELPPTSPTRSQTPPTPTTTSVLPLRSLDVRTPLDSRHLAFVSTQRHPLLRAANPPTLLASSSRRTCSPFRQDTLSPDSVVPPTAGPTAGPPAPLRHPFVRLRRPPYATTQLRTPMPPIWPALLVNGAA